MKVKELIELLLKEDPDATVVKTYWISSDSGGSGFEEDAEVDGVTAATKDTRKWDADRGAVLQVGTEKLVRLR